MRTLAPFRFITESPRFNQPFLCRCERRGTSRPVGTALRSPAVRTSPIVAPLKWKSSGVLIEPVSDDTHEIVSVKDPTVVYYDDMWHIYATTANTRGNWSIVYLSFKDWSEAANAKPYYIDQNPGLRGYHCAPQVFYFRPHKKWYLIYQSQHPQYSTTDDLSKPDTWTRPENFFASNPPGMPRLPIDYWIICDDTHAYLFFTGDNGRFTAAARRLKTFPNGMSDPETVIEETRETLFEGSMTYKIKGTDKYLTLVEGLGPKSLLPSVSRRSIGRRVDAHSRCGHIRGAVCGDQ